MQKPKYLFITYGEPGWRGVQMRGIRMAQYFNRDEVLFWNMFDSDFIRGFGYTVEDKHQSIQHPKDIVFPESLEAIIFTDIPTNEFFQYSVYQAALKHSFKVVICDQVYGRNQFKTGTFSKVIKNSDLFLLNSVSFFKFIENKKIKIIPPQIEYELNSDVKREMIQKYKIPQNSRIIFGVGYHEKVLEKIIQIAEALRKPHPNTFFIISGANDQKELIQKDNYIILPFNIGDDYFKILYTADILLVKFGFLQILESLALHKPTIVLGEAGYVLRYRDVVDEAYKEVLKFYPEITDETFSYIEKLISDESFLKEVVEKTKKIHNGELFGGRKAAEEIKKLISAKSVRNTYPKKLAVFVNDEITQYASWLQKQEDVYPLNFVVAMPTDKMAVKRVPPSIVSIPIKQLQFDHLDEALPHSFKELVVFSERKLDGFVDIFPWYDSWVEHMEKLIVEADTIHITDKGLQILNELIKKHKSGKKIIPF